MPGPPLVWIVPSVPVPLLSRQCAAVTTASVSWSAMSPVTSRRVVFPILVCIGIAETLLGRTPCSGDGVPDPESVFGPAPPDSTPDRFLLLRFNGVTLSSAAHQPISLFWIVSD